MEAKLPTKIGQETFSKTFLHTIADSQLDFPSARIDQSQTIYILGNEICVSQIGVTKCIFLLQSPRPIVYTFYKTSHIKFLPAFGKYC